MDDRDVYVVLHNNRFGEVDIYGIYWKHEDAQDAVQFIKEKNPKAWAMIQSYYLHGYRRE